jgi:hypothetical protein
MVSAVDQVLDRCPVGERDGLQIAEHVVSVFRWWQPLLLYLLVS